jgi:hypothetical protein
MQHLEYSKKALCIVFIARYCDNRLDALTFSLRDLGSKDGELFQDTLV